jgi:hypothetical protein
MAEALVCSPAHDIPHGIEKLCMKLVASVTLETSEHCTEYIVSRTREQQQEHLHRIPLFGAAQFATVMEASIFLALQALGMPLKKLLDFQHHAQVTESDYFRHWPVTVEKVAAAYLQRGMQ